MPLIPPVLVSLVTQSAVFLAHEAADLIARAAFAKLDAWRCAHETAEQTAARRRDDCRVWFLARGLTPPI